MNVYQLTAIFETDERDADGSVATYTRDLGVFSLVGIAETMMPLFAKNGEPWAYVLKERILDDLSYHGHFNQISGFRSVRTYFGDGTLNAENGCDDTGDRLWYGRNAETIRFLVGQFVSFLEGGRIQFGLVGDLPLTKKDFAAGRQGLEAEDDCYLVYTADGGHAHPFTPYVFPLLGDLPQRVKDRLLAARDRYLNDLNQRCHYHE